MRIVVELNCRVCIDHEIDIRPGGEEHEEVEIIDEAEFMKRRTPFLVKIGSSTGQERHTECSAVNSPKTAHVVGHGNHSISVSSEDDFSGFYQSRSSEKGNDSEDMDLDESETVRIDKAGLGKNTKRYSVATSSKMADIVSIGASAANCSKSRSSDKSSSSAKKGKDSETMDVNKLVLKIGSEAEFRYILKKISTNQARFKQRVYCDRLIRGECQRGAQKDILLSMIGRTQGFVGCCNHHSNNKNNSSPAMVISSSNPGIDMDRGIASRTRSKSMALKKSTESLCLPKELKVAIR